MKMTKTMLVKWLEGKQRDALCQVQEQFSQAQSDYKEKMNTSTNLRTVAAQISELTSKADAICDAWVDTVTMIPGIEAIGGYGSVKYCLAEILTVQQVEERLMRSISDQSEEMTALRDRKNKMDKEVKKNFQNVILNVKAMKDAKTGMKYLEELGFDLSELVEKENNPITTLAAPVDNTFLFIGR